MMNTVISQTAASMLDAPSADRAAPIHVAMIEPVGGYGGMQSYDYDLCNAIGSLGVRITLYTCEHSPPRAAGFETVVAFRKVFGKGSKIVRGCRYFVGLWRSLFAARAKPNACVHFHFFRSSLLEYLSVGLARLLGLPVIITVHDVESLCGTTSGLLKRRTYDGANALIAHNQTTRNELQSDLRIDAEKIAIVPHGHYLRASAGLCSREAARQQLGLQQDDRVLLFFGQIKRVKGLDLLLKALPEVVRSIPRVRLLIAGRMWKDDFDVYRNIIEELGLQSIVSAHIRYITDEETGVFFSAADLVALPYLKIYQSGVLLLAMSHERAVLASDLPGMCEIITDDVDGMLFRTADVPDLARRLIDGLADDEQRNRIAAAGYEMARRRFDWSVIGDKTIDVYRTVLQSRTNAASPVS